MRLMRFGVVALLVLAVFAGCGGDTTPPAEESSEGMMEQPAMAEPMMNDSMADSGMMHEMPADTGAGMMQQGDGGE